MLLYNVLAFSDGCTHSYIESGQQVSALFTKLLVGGVSLSVFKISFVFVKVRLGLISVHGTGLTGVHFSEVRNLLVLW